MTDRKPYLLRAIYQWIVDNDCTPHLVVAAPGAGWVHGVPSHLLQEEILVLNISPQATANLVIEDEGISFHTRFGGKHHQVWVGMPAITSLVARENSEGITLPVSENLEKGPTEEDLPMLNNQKDSAELDKKAVSPSSSHLKILK